MHFSSIFMAGQRRDIGLYDELSFAGLPGFSKGMIMELFQIAGIWLFFSDRLNVSVKSCIALGPRCFRWIIEIPSGPVALEIFAFFDGFCNLFDRDYYMIVQRSFVYFAYDLSAFFRSFMDAGAGKLLVKSLG